MRSCYRDHMFEWGLFFQTGIAVEPNNVNTRSKQDEMDLLHVESFYLALDVVRMRANTSIISLGAQKF
jgi:hypothetical protein